MATVEAAAASLLSLPWELRRAILLDVLKPRRQRRVEPVFDRKFMRERVRLRNLFDEGHAEATNIYVEKPGTWPPAPPARALQATNRQLRDEATLLITETLKKKGKARPKAPFILDIMVVKDIGVLPTWLSFPCKTRRILSLRVNVRIVRLQDAKAVPIEWVEQARYPADKTSATFWSFFAALTLIPLSRLRYRPAAAEGTTGIKSAAVAAAAPASTIKSTLGSIRQHRSSVVDAYLVPMEATPYVVDQLYIDFKPFEHRPNGKLMIPGREDKIKGSLFYEEGYTQFGREVFDDDAGHYGSGAHWLQPRMEETAAGRVASDQLAEYTQDSITRITEERPDDDLALYHYVLANSVGEVVYSSSVGNDMCMLSKATDSWISAYESIGDWRTMNISRAIAKEEAREHPARSYIALLQLAKRRRALGWQAQFDKENEALA